MRIPRYWAKDERTGVNHKGKEVIISAWGWSSENRAAAKELAAERSQKAFERLSSGMEPKWYEYLEHPLREEIIDSVRQGDKEIALITRNRYGALILNSTDVCFVDVDFPPIKADGLLEGISLLFSGKKKQEKLQYAQAMTFHLVKSWAQSNPSRSFRIYRTCAGLRLLFTDRLYDPTSEQVRALLGELKSDDLYCKLTERQQCFRARLTPKPWRCGCDRPPNRYPWESKPAEQKYLQWLREYEEMTKGYSTCQFIESVGAEIFDDSIAALVKIHDKYTCGRPEDKLA